MTIGSVLPTGTIVYFVTADRIKSEIPYERKGKYKVISSDNKSILLQKENSGYKEYISVIDLRLKRYKIFLENGTPINFEPIREHGVYTHGYRW